MSDIVSLFRSEAAPFGLELSDVQLEQYRTYFQWLVEWNEKMNLTAITDEEGVYFKHFYDSMTLLSVPQFRREGTLLDVGAGAGFPSLPVKIAAPDLNVTILDSLNKRIGFLNELVAALVVFALVVGKRVIPRRRCMAAPRTSASSRAGGMAMTR